jgi:hypothetical protein
VSGKQRTYLSDTISGEVFDPFRAGAMVDLGILALRLNERLFTTHRDTVQEDSDFALT